MADINISFSVMGTCSQRIELVEGCPYTPEQILDALKGGGKIWVISRDGLVLTTTQEGGQLVLWKDGGETVLGNVVDSSMDAGYSDFELEEE